jgi:hypothetical protein
MVLNFGPGLCSLQAVGRAARCDTGHADALPVCPRPLGTSGDTKRSEAKAGNQMAYSLLLLALLGGCTVWPFLGG